MTFFKRNNIKYKIEQLLLLFVAIISISNNVFSQSTGDYRTRNTGNWNATNVWQRYNGITWVNITTYPTAADGVISIMNGHTITFNMATIDVDQLVVNAGGRLQFASSPALLDFNVVDGPGVDLINNGTIVVSDYSSSDSRLKIFGQAVNNSSMTIEVDCHIHVYGTFTNNATITTNNENNQWTGKFYVFNGGVLICAPNSVIEGNGDFILNTGATIEIGSPQGISALGTNTGNIRTTYVREFSADATYIYNGIANQVTGNALTNADGVIINNTSGRVTFSRMITMNYLMINGGSIVNLSTYTHRAGFLSLPMGSFSTDTWGSTASSALHTDNIYFDVAANGIVYLTNQMVVSYSSSSTFTSCITDTAFKAIVETWGGGGKGGTRTNTRVGGGGGGGAYSRDTILITPGHVYTVVVGKGAQTTTAGEDSWFGTTANRNSALVLAKGGASVANNNANGALGGAANQGIGAVRYSGGAGANGITNNCGGGGGSSAGVAANGNFPPANQGSGSPPPTSRGAIAPLEGGDGGHAKFQNAGPGSPGQAPGGGGGGSYGGSGTNNGGFGADGFVKISYLPSSPSLHLLDSLITECRGVSMVYLKYSTVKGCPTLYMIDYNAVANSAGFQDVSYTALTPDSILIIIPNTAPAGVYQGIITIKSGGQGIPSSFPFTIKILENTFTTIANDVSCYGGNDGSVAVTITSENDAPYLFSINNGIDYSASYTGTYPNYILTGLSANTYKIRIKSNKGCISAICP